MIGGGRDMWHDASRAHRLDALRFCTEWLPGGNHSTPARMAPPSLLRPSPQYIEFVADRLLVALGNPKVRCCAWLPVDGCAGRSFRSDISR